MPPADYTFEQPLISDWLPAIPSQLQTPYELKGYPESRCTRIMHKYLDRPRNIARAWQRIHLHLPETIETSQKLNILELSTAHGAMLEVWRDAGHNCIGTDFNAGVGVAHRRAKPISDNLKNVFDTAHNHPKSADDPGWLYQPIIESLGLDVRLFSGGDLPYPFETKQFDVLACYQALEAYDHPDKWVQIVDEFCRITKSTIVIGFNPPGKGHFRDDAYITATKSAWESLRTYNKNGFVCSYFELGNTRRGLHPVVCKLTYTG